MVPRRARDAGLIAEITTARLGGRVFSAKSRPPELREVVPGVRNRPRAAWGARFYRRRSPPKPCAGHSGARNGGNRPPTGET